MKKTALIFALLIITCRIVAQNYPVQSNITITPPYSVYLSDYASISSNKLMVNMMLKDPLEPRVDITLRVSIKGNGIELRTRDDYHPQPIELNGGVPLILSGPDLESYLNPANLTFSGISKNEFVKTGKLPEGVYQFTVEAMSYDRPGIVLSNSGMTVGWLVLNDPPHWTLPMQNSLLTATYPQFVNFSWMPMNTGSPNAAFTTEYEFTIVELWPEDRAPGDAINSFAPLYQTTTSNTSLVYGPAEPELTPGRKYVCRLRAYDTEGRDLFKNNGYSEILVFTFGQACLPPNTFSDRIISPEEARVEWTSLPGNTQFTLSYSEQNADGTWSTWYHNEGIMPYSNLKNLKSEHKYRYQLKAICGTIESEYSEIKEFATPAADTTEIVCGKGAGVPDIDDSPPLPTLRIGDRIDAGGFTALVTEAEGSNGSFTGKCILFVKTFGHAPIYSEFTNIGVNQSMQLTSGSIKSVKGELKIHSVDSIINDLNDMLASDDDSDTDTNGDPNVGDPYQPGDSVTVILGGQEIIIAGDTTIVTPDGDTIVADFGQVPPIIVVNGDSTEVTTDELDFDNPGGGSAGNDDVASTVSDTAAYAITLVKFKRAKDQFFGFDQYPEDIPQFQADYSKEKVNEEDYPVHWKSSQSNGMNDKVVMEITAEVPDSIRTRLTIESSVSGPLNYNFNTKDSIWEVIVTGQIHENEDHIIAYYTQDDGTRIAVGHLNLVSYNKQNMKLVIVPVNNDYTLEAHALKDSLDNIYKGAITFWDVSVADPLEVDFEVNDVEGLDTELPDMAAYTKEMRKIRRELKDQPYFDGNAQYLFLVAKSEKGNKNGIMPFRRRYGFIFMEDDGKLKDKTEKLFHTMAHELGHGPFGLEHVWQEKGTTQGATYNLMDYTDKKPNNLLRKYQWYYIHNPKASLLGGDEEEVSSIDGYKHLWEKNLKNGVEVPAGKSFYITPSGSIIHIPYAHIAYFDSQWKEIPKGSLIGFKFLKTKKTYYSTYLSEDEKTPIKFKGYFRNAEEDSYQPNNPTFEEPFSYGNGNQYNKLLRFFLEGYFNFNMKVKVFINNRFYYTILEKDALKTNKFWEGDLKKIRYKVFAHEFDIEDIVSDNGYVNTSTYITPSGKPIRITGKHKAIFKHNVSSNIELPEGSLYGFVKDGIFYAPLITHTDYGWVVVYRDFDSKFAGYYDFMRYFEKTDFEQDDFKALENNRLKRNPEAMKFYEGESAFPIEENNFVKNVTISVSNKKSDRIEYDIETSLFNDYIHDDRASYKGDGSITKLNLSETEIKEFQFPKSDNSEYDETAKIITYLASPQLAQLIASVKYLQENYSFFEDIIFAVSVEIGGGAVIGGALEGGLLVHKGKVGYFGSTQKIKGIILSGGTATKITVFWKDIRYFEGHSYSKDITFKNYGASVIYVETKEGIELAGISGKYGESFGFPFSYTKTETNTGILNRNDLWPNEGVIKKSFPNKKIINTTYDFPKLNKSEGKWYLQVCANTNLGNEETLKKNYPNTNLIVKYIDNKYKYFLDIPFNTREEAIKYKNCLTSIANFPNNDMPFPVELTE